MRYPVRHWSTKQWTPPDPNRPPRERFTDGYLQLELFTANEVGENAMGKVESSSEKPGFFAKGGSGKMFGKGAAGRITPGQSGKESNSPPGGSEKFAKGGSGSMFGKGSAGKKTPGVSGKQSQSG
jgi:hypothetical protein